MSKTLWAALYGIILVAALAFTFSWSEAARAREAEREAVAKKQAALNAEIHSLETTVDANSRQNADLRARLEELQSHMAARKAAALRAATDPKVVALRLTAFRANLSRRYGALYRSLGLSAAQIDAFEDLMTAQREEINDLETAAVINGLDGSDPGFSVLRQREDDALRAALVSLLGNDGYQQLQQTQRDDGIRGILNRINLNIGSTDAPITDAQTQQLTAILGSADGILRVSGKGVYPGSFDWSAALARAQVILSPTQLEGYKASIAMVQVQELTTEFFQHTRPAK